MKLKLNQEEIQELHIIRNKDGTFNIHCETTPYKKKYNVGFGIYEDTVSSEWDIKEGKIENLEIEIKEWE